MGQLNEELIRKISNIKKEPGWMLEFRLNSLKSFFELDKIKLLIIVINY